MDANCIAINKMCGEAVEGAGADMGDLPTMIQRCLGENALAHPEESLADIDISGRLSVPVAVHRLDVPVTGCAVFALTQDALVLLNNAFAGKKSAAETNAAVEKRYWAIIEKPSAEIPRAAKLTHWLLFDPKRNKSTAYDKPGPGRKKAALAYRVVGTGQHYLFLEIELLTGRHHQIRGQLERIGLHIKGDLKYGARRSEPNGGIRLHARSLAFPHPSDGGIVTVRAEPPLMDNLWQAFTEQYASGTVR